MPAEDNQQALRQQLAQLFEAAADREEIELLINGLLTPSEIEEVAFRWRLIQALIDGKTQRRISQELSVSLGKISRGSRLLKYGPPRFRELAERLAAEVKERAE